MLEFQHSVKLYRIFIWSGPGYAGCIHNSQSGASPSPLFCPFLFIGSSDPWGFLLLASFCSPLATNVVPLTIYHFLSFFLLLFTHILVYGAFKWSWILSFLMNAQSRENIVDTKILREWSRLYWSLHLAQVSKNTLLEHGRGVNILLIAFFHNYYFSNRVSFV